MADSLQSDAEAVRWWLENGRRGDILETPVPGQASGTNERLSDMAGEIFPEVDWHYDQAGNVISNLV